MLPVKDLRRLLALLDSMVPPTSVDISEFRTVDLKACAFLVLACEVLDLIRLLEACSHQVHPEDNKVPLTSGVVRCLDSRVLRRALLRWVNTLKAHLVDLKACNKTRLPQTWPERVGLSLLTKPSDVDNHLRDHLLKIIWMVSKVNKAAEMEAMVNKVLSFLSCLFFELISSCLLTFFFFFVLTQVLLEMVG